MGMIEKIAFMIRKAEPILDKYVGGAIENTFSKIDEAKRALKIDQTMAGLDEYIFVRKHGQPEAIISDCDHTLYRTADGDYWEKRPEGVVDLDPFKKVSLNGWAIESGLARLILEKMEEDFKCQPMRSSGEGRALGGTLGDGEDPLEDPLSKEIRSLEMRGRGNGKSSLLTNEERRELYELYELRISLEESKLKYSPAQPGQTLLTRRPDQIRTRWLPDGVVLQEVHDPKPPRVHIKTLPLGFSRGSKSSMMETRLSLIELLVKSPIPLKSRIPRGWRLVDPMDMRKTMPDEGIHPDEIEVEPPNIQRSDECLARPAAKAYGERLAYCSQPKVMFNGAAYMLGNADARIAYRPGGDTGRYFLTQGMDECVSAAILNAQMFSGEKIAPDKGMLSELHRNIFGVAGAPHAGRRIDVGKLIDEIGAGRIPGMTADEVGADDAYAALERKEPIVAVVMLFGGHAVAALGKGERPGSVVVIDTISGMMQEIDERLVAGFIRFKVTDVDAFLSWARNGKGNASGLVRRENP